MRFFLPSQRATCAADTTKPGLTLVFVRLLRKGLAPPFARLCQLPLLHRLKALGKVVAQPQPFSHALLDAPPATVAGEDMVLQHKAVCFWYNSAIDLLNTLCRFDGNDSPAS